MGFAHVENEGEHKLAVDGLGLETSLSLQDDLRPIRDEKVPRRFSDVYPNVSFCLCAPQSLSESFDLNAFREQVGDKPQKEHVGKGIPPPPAPSRFPTAGLKDVDPAQIYKHVTGEAA